MRTSRPAGVFRLLAACLVLSVGPAARAAEPAVKAPPGGAEAFVRLREHRLFALHVARAGKSAEQRAREANQALASILESSAPATVRIEAGKDVATLYAGEVPVLELGLEDSVAAGAASLQAYGTAAAAELQRALQTERRRQTAQGIVLSLSLAVFSGLLAFLLIRKLGDLEGAVEGWLDGRPAGTPALRVGKVELASARAVRGSIHVALRFGKRLLQALVAYFWFLLALSMFTPTRGAGEQITRMMLEPVGRLLARIAGAVPQLLAVAVLLLLLLLVLRGVQLFFGSVARGETHLRWLPEELAQPTSTLLQFGVLLLAVLFAGPVITGGDTGPFQRLVQALLVGLALASAPLLAAVVAGLPVVYGRGLRIGEVAEVGGQVGVVKKVDLLSVVLEDDGGRAVRVPHLVSLFRPTRILGTARLTTIEVTVAGSEDPARLQALLLDSAGSHASGARVQLSTLDALGLRYRVTSGYDDVGLRVAKALQDAGVRLATLTGAGVDR